MFSAPPTSFSATKILLNRAARRLLWPHPSIYCPFGLARKRGNVLEQDVDLYISGYPRCGNTFSRTAFMAANPGVNLQSHRHIPTFVIHLVRCGMPGMVLIRNPLDAAVSWAIHENQTLEEAIAYWNDYYEMLLPVRSQLFLAPFEEVTADFGGVMRQFNARWRTSFVPFDHTPENAARCFQVTDDAHQAPDGKIREMQVCRPSIQRSTVKATHLRDLNQSSFLRDELARAKDLYETFLHYRVKSERACSTRLVPERAEGAGLKIGAPV